MNDFPNRHLRAPFDLSVPETRPPRHDAGQSNPDREAVERRRLDLERQVSELSDELHHTLSRVDRLERRLSAALAAFTRQQPAMASDEHAEQHDIAREYMSLLEQRLNALARLASTCSTLRVPAHGRMAPHLWFLSLITTALFGQRPQANVLRDTLQPRRWKEREFAPRADQALTNAQNLWERAEATGIPFAWDFTFTAGQTLDLSRQEPWPSCQVGMPGQFVVSPAYSAQGRVYVRQRLCTGPSFGDS